MENRRCPRGPSLWYYSGLLLNIRLIYAGRMARKKTSGKTRSAEYAGGFPPGMDASETLTDPRGGRAKRHYFREVLFIALAAMVSGTDDFEDFERFAQERED